MLIFYVGTRAQIIKMAPVIVEAEERNLPLSIILTGQHKETMDELMSDFGIKTSPVHLYDGPEVTGIFQMAKWFLLCLARVQRNRNKFLPTQNSEKNIVVVHGDTFSTLMGTIVGRINKIEVAHIESGLRSFNLFHPFPEELTRIITFKLSNIAFCPGEWAFGNVKKYNLIRVNTEQNTLIDSLRCALNSQEGLGVDTYGEEYGVCSIHRFENIFNKKQLENIVGLIEQVAQSHRLVFVLHPATAKKLTGFGLLKRLEANVNINLQPRMSYVKFIRLIKNSAFVITDGGSNQEELSYMGIPTCLMRRKTERQEGLESTVTICNYDPNVMKNFINTLSTKTDAEDSISSVDISPSKMIIDYLEKSIQGSDR